MKTPLSLNERRVRNGKAALSAWRRSARQPRDPADSIDAVADILHALHAKGEPVRNIVRIALGHFTGETRRAKCSTCKGTGLVESVTATNEPWDVPCPDCGARGGA